MHVHDAVPSLETLRRTQSEHNRLLSPSRAHQIRSRLVFWAPEAVLLKIEGWLPHWHCPGCTKLSGGQWGTAGSYPRWRSFRVTWSSHNSLFSENCSCSDTCATWVWHERAWGRIWSTLESVWSLISPLSIYTVFDFQLSITYAMIIQITLKSFKNILYRRLGLISAHRY